MRPININARLENPIGLTRKKCICAFQDAYKQAEADFGTSDAKKRSKKRPKHADGEDDGDQEDAFFRTLIAHDKLPKFVELLKFKVRSSTHSRD